ncbi:MAG: hypothetical protein LBU72_00255 [Burkholderiaceae bacterium]|jgi:hypothetical protein|nr:hypothetical protein [Burkholderiaceae bacterium]
MQTTTKLTIAVICGLALTACGGGGDDSGNGSSNDNSAAQIGGVPPGGDSSSGGSSSGNTLTFRYEALASVDDPMTGSTASFLTQVNAEGAKGYRYLSDDGFSNDAISSIFVNDGTVSSYTYELIADPGNIPDLVIQANTEGAKGYRYEGELMIGAANYSLYRQDNGSSATYTYVADSVPTSATDWLVQADGRGQSGYWLVSPIGYGSTESNLYMKNNASSTTYTYDALTPPASLADLLTQLNSEGAKGYRAKGEMVIGGEEQWLYMKDQTQSATFTYLSDAVQGTSALFINQANNYGAQGNAYFSDLVAGTTGTSMPVASFYFKASNCSGFMCTALNPLIQN